MNDKPKGQLSNRGIKPKEDRHQRIGDSLSLIHIYSIAFVNAGKKDATDTPATKARKAAKAEGEAPVPPADAPQRCV